MFLCESLVEKKKSEIVPVSEQKSKAKKVALLEEQLRVRNQELMMVKFKSMFFLSATMIIIYNLLSGMYEGRVVAKLPFTPFPFIRGITHRGLPGTDWTDCSSAFIYALCSLSIRSNVTKFFGFAPKGSNDSIFAPPTDSSKAW